MLYQYIPNVCKLFRTWNMFSHRNNVVNIGSVPRPVHAAYLIHMYLRYRTNVCLSPGSWRHMCSKVCSDGYFLSIFWKDNSPLGIFQRNYFWYLSLSLCIFSVPEPSCELTVKAGTTSYLIWPWKGKQCTLFNRFTVGNGILTLLLLSTFW